MYKILGRKVAEYPGIAKPESQKKDPFSGIMIIWFKKDGKKIERYKKIIKYGSGNQGRKAAISILKSAKPDYIAVMRFDGLRSPEIITKKGDKRMVDAFLAQTRRVDQS